MRATLRNEGGGYLRFGAFRRVFPHPLRVLFLLVTIGALANVVRDVLAADGPKPALPDVERPRPAQPPIGVKEDKHLDKKPVRETKGLDLTRMGWSYNCMECHKLFPAQWTHSQYVEHKNIQLNHGKNRFCLNCHHSVERNTFVDYDGSVIPEAHVVDLCAKCHGPAHRDWQAGVHGRRNGYWQKDKGTQTRLRCIQCHDPHNPKFKPIKPLTAPTYPKRAAKPKSAEHEPTGKH